MAAKMRKVSKAVSLRVRKLYGVSVSRAKEQSKPKARHLWQQTVKTKANSKSHPLKTHLRPSRAPKGQEKACSMLLQRNASRARNAKV
jgi:hypothetical protein